MRRRTSWPVATWVAPVVPTLVVCLLVIVDPGDSWQSVGYRTGLGCALAVGAVGWLLYRTRHAGLRGLGLGLAAGGTVTALVVLAALVS